MYRRFVRRHRLNKAIRELDKFEEKYSKEYKKLKKERMPDEAIQGILSDADFDIDMARNDVMLERSGYLVFQAEQLFIPVPTFKGQDDGVRERAGDASGRWHLTIDAQKALAKDIRKERAERSERFRSWVPAIASVIAALGSLAGVGLQLILHDANKAPADQGAATHVAAPK